ncbi:UDP-N-acetylglucosamine transferase subunit ALG14 homolog isoform X2 [Pipistrellus kuhlii]|uniref:UDP-N-acetylglucosamine transferase subunit ALG14 n=1 Tax=Pipistrellus kuhlii TaxID=59472 RepID=A0A7J7TVG6_PIPKU|nr:UDP-N-acetylglucosamine transferase subunit ALG14 homolog isoform X2 [Pipistrellus kuhlii]KAF6304587.1 ALG14 UDP-N-acetylglucosaminyltransferase subunit [Pipistrellus kuhlii]
MGQRLDVKGEEMEFPDRRCGTGRREEASRARARGRSGGEIGAPSLTRALRTSLPTEQAPPPARRCPPGPQAPRYFLHRIPRSREVRQPWLTTVLTTLHAACLSLPLTLRVRPDLVLCNGPGTCVPVCAAAVLLGVLGVKRVTLVYVESLCRVEHLSLTGRLLRPFADYFLVQWPALKAKYPSSVYLGRIV